MLIASPVEPATRHSAGMKVSVQENNGVEPMLASPQPKAMLGPYRCRTLLGAGAGGRVWLADGAEGQVALKIAESTAQRERLRREAELLGWMEHDAVVRRIDFDPGGAWLALAYVEGQDLLRWSAGRPLGQIIAVVRKVADALAFLHELELVHGDLKPSNILVDSRGQPRLIDLGLARVVGEPPLPGFHGTLGYAAPELLSGGAPSYASDVYALGAVLYALLTGHPPFGDRDPAALAWLPSSTLPPPPSASHPRLPQLLDGLVMRMLAQRPEVRPTPTASVSELLRRSLRSPPEQPVVGTRREREILRELIVAAGRGDGHVVIVHGPHGSGRSTLIREAVISARREGFRVIEDVVNPREALAAVRADEGPCLLTARGRGRSSMELGAKLLAEKLPCLALIEADAPMMTLESLGAIHLTPSALTVAEVAWVMEAWGLDPAAAADLHARTGGLPADVMAHVRSPGAGIADIGSQERAILALVAHGPLSIEKLAEAMGCGLHDALDRADVLLSRGILVEQDDGARLSLARK